MQTDHFDLNDIDGEPTDTQLQILMQTVLQEVQRRAEQARLALTQRLREDMDLANKQLSAP